MQHPLQPHCLLIYGGLDDSESYLDDLLILDTATCASVHTLPAPDELSMCVVLVSARGKSGQKMYLHILESSLSLDLQVIW